MDNCISTLPWQWYNSNYFLQIIRFTTHINIFISLDQIIQTYKILHKYTTMTKIQYFLHKIRFTVSIAVFRTLDQINLVSFLWTNRHHKKVKKNMVFLCWLDPLAQVWMNALTKALKTALFFFFVWHLHLTVDLWNQKLLNSDFELSNESHELHEASVLCSIWNEAVFVGTYDSTRRHYQKNNFIILSSVNISNLSLVCVPSRTKQLLIVSMVNCC